MLKVTGEFEVNLNALDTHSQGTDGIILGRMSIDKTFKGELDASSRGEMLSAMTPVKGSAAYVAIEQVSGILAGRKGSFVLQHFGTMNQGHNRFILEVVPNSGTGELTGLSGSMIINVQDGQHVYELDYELE